MVSKFTPEVRESIAARVEAGASLVLAPLKPTLVSSPMLRLPAAATQKSQRR